MPSLLPLRGVSAPLAALVGLRHHAARLSIREHSQKRGSLAGSRSSRFRGRGMDFDEVRLYQPGDDVRAIDWRVTARKGAAHTKLFRAERERPLLIAIDARPRMAFGSRVRFKSVAAAELAALAAWSALARGDRVGGLVFDDAGNTLLRPHRSERAVLRLLAVIAESSPTAITDRSVSDRAAPASLAATIDSLARAATHGSLAVIISDFHGLDAPAVVACERLVRRAEVVCLQVHDALEAELPPPALYTLSDGQQRRLLDSGDPSVRDSHRALFAARCEALRALAARTGLHWLRIGTGDDAGAALVQSGLIAGAR